MEKCSQKRPRCRWLAWCSGPPAPRVTALACTTCSSSPIRQTYTCGNGRSRSAEKYLYDKKIFGNRMMRPTRTWSNAEQMRHNIVLTWPQPRIEPRKEQPPGEERGFHTFMFTWPRYHSPGRRILLVSLALLCFQLGALICWCAIRKDSVLKWEIISIHGPSHQIKSADSNAMDGNV